jgi:hypothetical protein
MFTIEGTVIPGLGAAGLMTVVRQMPHFEAVIPEMKGFHPATINLQLDGALRIDTPDRQTDLAWSGPKPERFSFLRIGLEFPIGNTALDAWIYVPHDSPHFGKRCQVEIIAPKISGLSYGSRCRVQIHRGRTVPGLIIV